MPTIENGSRPMWPQCCTVGMWQPYAWQCDMIGILAVRHSDTEPVKWTTVRFLYIDAKNDNT